LDDILSYIDFFFADDILSSRQISDWSKHKKSQRITVTSRITFLGYPRKYICILFFHKNARDNKTQSKLRQSAALNESAQQE